MSTQIRLLPGGLYAAELHGKTITSPSYKHLAEQVGVADSAADRATARQQAQEQEQTARKAAAAAQLADLAPRKAAAIADRDAAWSALSVAALDAVVETYAQFAVAHRHASALRFAVADARHEAQHGKDRRAGMQVPPPSLLDALTQIADSRIAELRSQTAG